MGEEKWDLEGGEAHPATSAGGWGISWGLGPPGRMLLNWLGKAAEPGTQWTPGRQTRGRSLTIARSKISAPLPSEALLSAPALSSPHPLSQHCVMSEI